MVPELIDHVKTRISYLIATFKPYEQLIKQRVFKNAQEFFSRGPSQRYEVLFFVRWQQFNSTNPQDTVKQIHNDMKKRGFNLKLLAQLFKELDEDFIRMHR